MEIRELWNIDTPTHHQGGSRDPFREHSMRVGAAGDSHLLAHSLLPLGSSPPAIFTAISKTTGVGEGGLCCGQVVPLFRPWGQSSILPRALSRSRSPRELLLLHSRLPGASPVPPLVPWARSSGQYWSSMYCSMSVPLSGSLSSGGARRLLATCCSHCTSTSR